MTYSIQLFIPAEYAYPIESKADMAFFNEKLPELGSNSLKLNKVRIKQDLFFGEIPLITEEGTFVINGCERIVISQIIRSPGVYFRKEFGTIRKTIYTATIISNKGLWTKFVLDQCETQKKKKTNQAILTIKDRIYIKLNDFKSRTTLDRKEDDNSDNNKLFIYDLIRYFGLSIEEILDTLKYPLHFSNLQLTNREIEDVAEERQRLVKLYENCLVIKKLFFNQRSGCFSIGEIGRYKINKKLGLNLPKDITYLTAQDFIGIIDGLIELKYYDKASDDIDDIKNKQIRCIGDLLQNQIRVGLYRLQKSIIDDKNVSTSQKLSFELETQLNPEEWIIDPRPVTSSIKEFFKTSQLSQFMDQINPLAEMTHKRRISVFGPNGLKRDHISTVISDIHPSLY